MFVYRVFTRVGRLLSFIASCFLSLFHPFHALLNGQEDGLFLWDFMYLRSRFLQTHFNYRLNYRANELESASELHSLVAKCGIWHEKHANIDRCATSGGQVDLYRLSSKATTGDAPRQTIVLIHGILQSVDVFVCGGQRSLAAHILRTGCDVWLLHKSHLEADAKERSVSATPTLSGLRSPGLVEAEVSTALPAEEKTRLTCSNLVAVAQFIATYHQHQHLHQRTSHYDTHTTNDTAVCWVGHSTGCEAILTALSYKSTVQASVTAELRRRTSGAVLLSPVLTLTHLNVHAGKNSVLKSGGNGGDGSTGTNGSDGASGSIPNTVLLHEVLLHSPDTAYSLLGHDTMLLSLQQWRDILSPRTYCSIVVPLCRHTLGWTFGNIAQHRRAELIPHLLHPTPTTPLVTLLFASQGAHQTPSVVYSVVLNVYTACRWWWKYSLLVTDVGLRLAGCIVGGEVSVFGLGKSSTYCAVNDAADGVKGRTSTSSSRRCNATLTTTATRTNTKSSTNNTSYTIANTATSFAKPLSAKRSTSYSTKTKIVSFVGTHDALANVAELEQRLSVLGEQYSFENDVRQVCGYEHMDTLWADSAPELVFDSI